jgi:hypothetical protein
MRLGRVVRAYYWGVVYRPVEEELLDNDSSCMWSALYRESVFLIDYFPEYLQVNYILTGDFYVGEGRVG